MTKSVFLDRDGVLIHDSGYISSISKVRLLEGVPEALSQLSQNGFLLVIVTNQSAVARGCLSEESLKEINEHVLKKLAERNVRIDAVYYCPHHPTLGVGIYRRKCACRKPAAGMLLQASEELGIDLEKSYIVGDKKSDILAGTRAGCKTVFLGRWDGGIPAPSFVARDLADAGRWIVDDSRKSC